MSLHGCERKENGTVGEGGGAHPTTTTVSCKSFGGDDAAAVAKGAITRPPKPRPTAIVDVPIGLYTHPSVAPQRKGFP